MLSYMDPSVDPCQDFYLFSCGNWVKKNPIPKDKAAYDTFEMLRENLDVVLRELLEEKPTTMFMDDDAPTVHNDATIKAKHFYQSCMNYGWPMLRPEWDPSQFDCILLMAELKRYNNDILVSEWVGPDIKNSDEYVIQVYYIIRVATLLGVPVDVAVRQVEDMIYFETRLAEITSQPDDRGNMSAMYQRMTVGELRQWVPQLNWYRYLSLVLGRNVQYAEPIVIFSMDYIQDLVNLLSQTRSQTIANYLLWRFIRNRVNNLDDRFQDAKQRFNYILFGSEESPPRWKNCVAQVNNYMGMALGAMFVQKYFDQKSKKDTLQMTEEIMQSFRELLTETRWIDKETKELAAQKLLIHSDQYFENILNILKHLTKIERDHLGAPVNKSVWNTAPAVVNAYYSRNKNQINQYSKYMVDEVALHIDGVNTQGENIADNGGIKQAFKAYKRWLNEHGIENENLPGINLNGFQLFFLNFAQIWCGDMRPEATRINLKTAVHAPGKFRVIGTLSNSEDFAAAYNCEIGSPMNPFTKCSVW
ncbi:hypothetical protein C0J52_24825 [Blattella germanica]|nr:hypothetical protein C0J52_24825 [Blattella germanica]